MKSSSTTTTRRTPARKPLMAKKLTTHRVVAK
jgi:hypothetical protein